jgi:hypothetical protein
MALPNLIGLQESVYHFSISTIPGLKKERDKKESSAKQTIETSINSTTKLQAES